MVRRPETVTTEQAEIEGILMNAEVGSLGIVTEEGSPRVVPVNYVSEGSTVYFHGAMKGEKYEALRREPRVTFSVYIPLSVIPSYWLAEENALGATHFFKSVQIDGRAQLVEDAGEKARALQSLMEKYQPEGKFKQVTVDEPLYQAVLGKTLIVMIEPDRVSARLKLGQNYTETTRRRLIKLLDERAEGPDIETAAEMRRTLKQK